MLTVEQAATDIASGNVALSLALYVILYAGLLVAYLHTVFLMARRAVEIEEIQESEHQGDYAQRLFTQHMTAKENAHV